MSHKPLVFLLLFMMLLPTLIVFSEDVAATSHSVDLTDLADTYVSEAAPTVNYGTSIKMVSGYSAGKNYFAYMKFNVSLIPIGSTITGALMYVDIKSKYISNNTIDIITSTWVESTVTWNTKPTSSSNYTVNWVIGSTGWLSVNITSIVSAWYAGTITNYGVRLSSPSAIDYNEFYSLDSGNLPYIQVHYTTIAPVAAFSGTPLIGGTGSSRAFTDASTNTPTNWTWNFGDTQTSYLQSPVHAYAVAGSYTVSLKATNSAGSSWCNKTNYITVTSHAPAFINSPNVHNTPKSTYTYTATLNESSTISMDVKPAWATLAGKTISGIPGIHGNYPFSMKAISTNGTLAAWLNWTLIVTGWGPTFTTSPTLNATIGVNWTYTPHCNESCTISITMLPGWGHFSGGVVYGTPTAYGLNYFEIRGYSTNGTLTTIQDWVVNVPLPAATVSTLLIVIVLALLGLITAIGFLIKRLFILTGLVYMILGVAYISTIDPLLGVLTSGIGAGLTIWALVMLVEPEEGWK